jgi:hypothetical protein
MGWTRSVGQRCHWQDGPTQIFPFVSPQQKPNKAHIAYTAPECKRPTQMQPSSSTHSLTEYERTR